MRFGIMVMAALGMAPIVLTQTSANALPYDPYPWCANYDGGRGSGDKIAVFRPGINAWRP
jgi:hypothetical protein